MGVCRYKTAHFKGYFLGARAVLDIFYEFAPVMESGRKNEGAILHLLMQFKRKIYNTLFARGRFTTICLLFLIIIYTLTILKPSLTKSLLG